MRKILLILFVLISVQSFGQNKKYAERLNVNGTIDSFYLKRVTDSVFAYSNDAFISFTVDHYNQIVGAEIPNQFGNFHLDADGIYRNKTPRAEAVDPTGITGSTAVGRALLATPTPASTSLMRVNNDGTVGTRTIAQAITDLGIDLKASINNAAFTGTFDAPNGTITNADLAGSIDLTTKVTGVLPFLNGGSSGGSTATPATTGTMTVNMTSRIITITPTGSCTFNASGGLTGQMITFVVTTSGTTSFTLTWGTNFRKVGTLATGTVSARFFAVSFICLDGTTWMEISRTSVQN